MTDRNEESAFPASDNSALLGYTGMTMREWFAGQALVGMLANPNHTIGTVTFEQIGKDATKFADAMLEALK